MFITFAGKVVFWKGPVPFVLIEMPREQSDFLKNGVNELSY